MPKWFPFSEKHAFHQQEMTFAMADVTPSFLELVRRFCGSTDGKRKKRDTDLTANRSKKLKPDEERCCFRTAECTAQSRGFLIEASKSFSSGATSSRERKNQRRKKTTRERARRARRRRSGHPRTRTYVLFHCNLSFLFVFLKTAASPIVR